MRTQFRTRSKRKMPMNKNRCAGYKKVNNHEMKTRQFHRLTAMQLHGFK